MNKELLKLAIPNIISNLSVPLLTTVDTALMGRQEGAEYIGAIALGGLIFNFIYWSFGFLRMGTTGLTAQAYGKKDKVNQITIFGRALFFAIISSLVILLIQVPLGHLSFQILDGSTEVETLALSYFFTRIWAAPATLAIYVFIGWFFGMQNAVYPLIITVIINLFNIIFNYIFVVQLGMKADGVALGTVCAQYLGLITCIILFLFKYKSVLQHIQYQLILKLEELKQFFALNRDIFIRTFCLVFAFAFFENASAKMGNEILAANSILLQLLSWVSFGIDGFGHATESLAGQFLGSNNKTKFNKTIRYSFLWSFGLAAIYGLCFWLFETPILSIFTDQPSIISLSSNYIIWMFILPIIAAPSYVMDGIYVGITASKAMRITMGWALLLFLLTYFILSYSIEINNNLLWSLFVLFFFLRAIIQWIYYKRRLLPTLF